MPNMMEKVKIGGIKLSSKLIQLSLLNQDDFDSSISLFFKILNKNQINMPFISTTTNGGISQACCCVSSDDENRIRDIINKVENLKTQIQFINEVGMLSVFPHGSSLKILGLLLFAFGNARIPIFGISSSISTLTFIIDYGKLKKAITSLSSYFDLPASHAPFKSDISLETQKYYKKVRKLEKTMETAAVYWEPKIKTYGLQEAYNLSLLELTIKPEQIANRGLHINKLDKLGIHFKLVMFQYLSNQRLRIHLLFQRKWEEKVQKHIHKQLQMDGKEFIQIKSPVELIYFHGPHFGDRHGIADSAFSALSNGKFPILVAGCSGAAIHLVLPENGIQRAKFLLADILEVPQILTLSNHLNKHGR